MKNTIHQQSNALRRVFLGLALLLASLCLITATPMRAEAAVTKAWSATRLKPRSTTLTPSGGTWKVTKKGVRFRQDDGSYAVNTFLKISKSWYHFNKKGYVSKGWFTVSGYRYYACKTPAANGVYGDLATGWTLLGTRYLYFAKSSTPGKAGRLAIGWKKIKGNYYYFKKNGNLVTGWKTLKGKTFYFKPSGDPGTRGKLTIGWKTIDKVKYYFTKKGEVGTIGALYTDTWATIGKKTYYFATDGAMQASASSRKEAFIELIGAMAKKDMASSGILASITVAQAIIESNYGQSELAVNSHNLFGMKETLSSNNWASVWTGSTYTVTTREETTSGKSYYIHAAFRSYPSYALSVADHSAYLAGAKKSDGTLRYKGLVGCKNYTKAAKIIKDGGYATASNYVSALVAVIEQNNLTRFDS